MPQLTWLGDADAKQAARRVPYRLLESVEQVGDPAATNWLIQGDNLEALKALLPFYAGRVKCIFIDPPYNTKSAFEHYDDNLEHSQWLSMMYPRLEVLRDLLDEDGSIWITADDNEAHYLKILLDDVFGRRHFIANVLWQKRTSPESRLRLGAAHDHILVFGRDAARAKLNRLSLTTSQANRYRNPDNDPLGSWTSTDMTAQGWRPNQMYVITTPSGVQIEPPPGRCWGMLETEYLKLREQGRIWFGRSGDARPRVKSYLSEASGISAWSWWTHSEVGHNQEAKRESNEIFGATRAFATPKPERLIYRAIEIATDPHDIVLDSFLGSGTTAAVAHKMNRRWIGIEMGDHAVTHCLPRLKKVVEGEQGGISESVGWKGGGGFRFLKLGAPAFTPDGRINPAVRFPTLAAFIWFLETSMPHPTGRFDSPLLGVDQGTAYFLLYNGILGDRRPASGNILTGAVWEDLRERLPGHTGPSVVYGEMSRLGPVRLRSLNVTFKQIPYDIRIR